MAKAVEIRAQVLDRWRRVVKEPRAAAAWAARWGTQIPSPSWPITRWPK